MSGNPWLSDRDKKRVGHSEEESRASGVTHRVPHSWSLPWWGKSRWAAWGRNSDPEAGKRSYRPNPLLNPTSQAALSLLTHPTCCPASYSFLLLLLTLFSLSVCGCLARVLVLYFSGGLSVSLFPSGKEIEQMKA